MMIFWTNYGVLEQCARVLEFINDFGTKSCSNEKKSKCKVINNKKSDTRKKSSESDLGHGLVIFWYSPWLYLDLATAYPW